MHSLWLCLGDYSLTWLYPSLLATNYLMPTVMVQEEALVTESIRGMGRQGQV